jgi:hypothetical protein
VITVSGHAPDAAPLEVGTDVVTLLPKPYPRLRLLQAVAAALRPSAG